LPLLSDAHSALSAWSYSTRLPSCWLCPLGRGQLGQALRVVLDEHVDQFDGHALVGQILIVVRLDGPPARIAVTEQTHGPRLSETAK
jgi:hypothetical protein